MSGMLMIVILITSERIFTTILIAFGEMEKP